MVIRPVVSLRTVPAEPWKNGGGTTRTLAVSPAGASLEDFLWRVSLAEVERSGPFSRFGGIDRSIALWSGKGMLLESPGLPAHWLDEPLEPYEFAGEVEVKATLLDGPTTDLNLMIRRDAVAATLVRCECKAELPQADDLLLVCRRGRFGINLRGEESRTLFAEQMLHVSNLAGGALLEPIEPGSALLCVAVSLTAASDSAS